MYAAKGNHAHTCQELLLNGANFKLENLNGDTAHVIAVENDSALGNFIDIYSYFDYKFYFYSSSGSDEFYYSSIGSRFIEI